MKKNSLIIAGIALLLFMMGGCSMLPIQTGKAEQQQLQAYLDSGQHYESQGKLAEARKQYELALTIDADNPEAKEGAQRVKKKARTLAEQHYSTGMRYHRRGRLEQARREFLIVLRLEPEHQGALRALRPYKYQYGPAKRYVVHTIKPGESLSMLAKMYYGDFKQYLLIADFNNIANPTYIEVGQDIKIPEVAGLPFLADQYLVKTEPEIPPTPEYEEPAAPPAEVMEKAEEETAVEMAEAELEQEYELEAEASPATEEVPLEMEEGAEGLEASEDVAVVYRDLGIELFEKKDYAGAIAEFAKVLNLNPDDEIAKDYLLRSHFQLGIEHFNDQDYETALAEFTKVLDRSPDDENALDYIGRVHLQVGIAHFNQNEQEAARAAFTEVLTLNPQQEEAISYLSQSYFKEGVDQFNKEDYLQARENFDLALDYDSNCEECRKYRDRCDETFLETHYNKGLSYYGKQQLTEAIREWELVASVNAEYRDVTEKLSKAKELQERLENIKKHKK